MIAFGDSENRYHISDAASGSVISVFQGSARATSVTFSADGSLFASGDNDGDIRVWDIQTGVCKVLFQGGRKNWVESIAFAPKGTLLASGTEDGKVRIWEMISEDSSPKHTIEAHTALVTSVCWSNEGSKVLSGSVDSSMKIWDASTGDRLHIIWAKRSISRVAWSPDGSKIGLSTKGEIAVYDAQTHDQLRCFESSSNGLGKSFDFSSKGDHVIYGSGTSLLVRSLNPDIIVTRFVGHTYNIQSVASSSGGTFVVSGGQDGYVKVWRFGNGQRSHREQEGSNVLSTVSFSPNGRLSGGGHSSHEGSKVPSAVSFSPNGRLMATATSGKQEVVLWDAITFSHFDTLFLDREQVGSLPRLAFSPDSSLIGCGFGPDKSIRIWDVSSVISDIPISNLNRFCFSPDGDRLAVVENRLVRLWDVRQGNILAELTWTEVIGVTKIIFFEDGSGILITRQLSDPIGLDIIASPGGQFLFKFVTSSNENPRVILKHASYRLAYTHEWILDSKNRRVCWIPPDQRYNPSNSLEDAQGSKIAWGSRKEFICLDFSRVSTDTDVDNH